VKRSLDRCFRIWSVSRLIGLSRGPLGSSSTRTWPAPAWSVQDVAVRRSRWARRPLSARALPPRLPVTRARRLLRVRPPGEIGNHAHFIRTAPAAGGPRPSLQRRLIASPASARLPGAFRVPSGCLSVRTFLTRVKRGLRPRATRRGRAGPRCAAGGRPRRRPMTKARQPKEDVSPGHRAMSELGRECRRASGPALSSADPLDGRPPPVKTASRPCGIAAGREP
jgi:hypothetical protein